jgi:hypothetical protein
MAAPLAVMQYVSKGWAMKVSFAPALYLKQDDEKSEPPSPIHTLTTQTAFHALGEQPTCTLM